MIQREVKKALNGFLQNIKRKTMKIDFNRVLLALSIPVFALIMNMSLACRWTLNANQTNGENNRQIALPTPEPELNAKRLPTMWFLAWHRSKPGMILKEGLHDKVYLASPGEKPAPFAEYDIPLYSDDGKSPRSHTGKYEVNTNKFNERSVTRGCCAIQEFDYEVIISEVGFPNNKTKLADENWKFEGWSPDDKFILFSDGGQKLFLIDVATKETISISSDRSLRRGVFTPDKKGLFIAAFSQGAYRIEYFDFATRQLTNILSPVEGWQEMNLSPDGGKLAIFSEVFRGKTTETVDNYMSLFDTASKAKIGEYALAKGGINSFSGWKPDGREFAFTVGGENYAQDVYTVNVETGKLTRWYPPEGETTGLYK